MKIEFIPGQRWMSDTDAELGLGVVAAVEVRLVRIDFPACGTSRTYARTSAPLSRLRLAEGDPVRDQSGRQLVVRGLEEQGGLIIYQVKDESGELLFLAEGDIHHGFRPNRPQEKLLSNRFDQVEWFRLRYLGWVEAARNARSPVYGLSGPRVDIIPHQMYIASEVSSRHAPRVLLADEVGLGKTIEAGLILHRMLLTGRIKRVLVVVPEALSHQWLVEMLRRFNLHFALYDEERFDESLSENPFLENQCVLCSLDFLVSSKKVARAALSAQWDMLVVDEAHHLHWTEEGSTLEYDLVSELARNALGALLLTATPEQLGQAGHFARLHLLDPHRYHDYQAFMEEERNYQVVAELASRLAAGRTATTEDRSLLARLPGDLSDLDGDQLMQGLLDQHGVGRVLFRNTRAAITGFPKREIHVESMTWPEQYRALDAQSWELLFPERLLEGWSEFDPRVPWLVERLRLLHGEKVLLICAHASTVLELKLALQSRYGIGCAVFHEHMEIVERDRAAAYFADKEAGAQLLLCSEIGSEGRNFQFAHHLVLFDLPLEADLLEQRIGRLDRIGQSEDIKLHIPRFQQGPQAILYRWYEEALDAFSHSSSVPGTLFDRHAAELLEHLGGAGDLDGFIRRIIGERRQLESELESGRDRLLELNSCRPDEAQRLVQLVHQREASAAVRDYMEKFWALYGVEQETGSAGSEILKPGNHMLHDSFPGLSNAGATVCFRREDALAHEDRLFLTWEHPMVRGAMDMLFASDLGCAAMEVVRHPDFKPGSFLLELIYLLECTAPAELEAGRFLPPTPVRLLLDRKGQNLANHIGTDLLAGKCLSHDRKTAALVIRSLDSIVRELLKLGLGVAEQSAKVLVEGALRSVDEELGTEISRMERLALHNPAVREEEIEFVRTCQELLNVHISQAGLRLDCMRLIMFR